MSFLPDYDDAIGRVRFVGVGRAKYRKRVRGEDRYEDCRYRKGTARFHAKRLLVRSIRFYDAFVGFSRTTEGGIATPSSEVNAANESFPILVSSLVAFRGEDRFRIGAGYFAHRNPAEATNQRADQKRDGREWDLAEQAEDKCKRAGQNFADPNQPA